MTTLGNRSHETSTTTGTGTYSLAGAVTDRLTLKAGAARVSGDNTGPWTVDYIVDDGAGGYETGRGVLTSGSPDTLTRATVRDSSNGGSAVNWGAGTRQVKIAPDGEILALLYDVEAATDAATAGAIAKRDGSGNLKVATPSASGDAATKGYVDGAISPVQSDADDAQAAADAAQADIDAHAALTNNPHSVTKTQVGLGNVLDFAQLYLTAATVGAAGSLAFSNGTATFVLKWGAVAGITAGADEVVTYPAAFPTATLAVMTQHRNSSFSGSNSVTTGVHSETAAAFTIKNNAGMTVDLFWFAIGH